MEFEELQALWNNHDSKQGITIDEAALSVLIRSKKKNAHFITDLSEWVLVVVNVSCGIFILGSNAADGKPKIMLFILAGWMLVTACYIFVSRIRRRAANGKFDRSLAGELANAISVASYQVRLSAVMRWNTIPIAVFIILGLWEARFPYWSGAIVIFFFGAAFLGSKWEHSFYKSKKNDLERMRSSLIREEFQGNESITATS